MEITAAVMAGVGILLLLIVLWYAIEDRGGK